MFVRTGFKKKLGNEIYTDLSLKVFSLNLLPSIKRNMFCYHLLVKITKITKLQNM